MVVGVCGVGDIGYLWGEGRKRGRTRARSKGRRKDTERSMKVQRMVYGGISRVVSVVCGGVVVREKHEVRGWLERGARREEA